MIVERESIEITETERRELAGGLAMLLRRVRSQSKRLDPDNDPVVKIARRLWLKYQRDTDILRWRTRLER